MVTKTSSHSPAGTPDVSSPNQSVMIVLLIASLLLNTLCLYFLLGYSFDLQSLSKGDITKADSSIGIKKVLLDLEYDKVGGKENYDILQKYTQLQINEQIPQIKQALAWWKLPGAQQQQPQAAAAEWTISADEIKKILDDASIEGDKNATIIAIEYSDMECPFCMKQYHDTKLFPTLMSQYGNKVSAAFKNNRWVNHKGTEVKALGALCAAKIWGDASYQKFYKGVMDKSTNEGGVLDTSKLAEIAKLSWVDVAKWQSCVDTKETISRFAAQTSEAQKFGLGWTPGTLILNIKTGKYATVEWAYPYSTFTAKIDELMK
jgi:protein-disulfide isomerase